MLQYLGEHLTMILAIWGALLGTIGTGLAAYSLHYQLRRDKHSVRLFCAVGRPPSTMGETREDCLVVRVVNNAHRPIEIRSVGLRAKSGQVFTLGNEAPYRAFPKLIDESASLEPVFFSFSELEKAMREHSIALADLVQVLVLDAENREFTSDVRRLVNSAVKRPST